MIQKKVYQIETLSMWKSFCKKDLHIVGKSVIFVYLKNNQSKKLNRNKK